MASTTTPATPTWTFVTNHALVLLRIAQDPEIRLRDVAASVGITERAVQRIISDLEAGGYLSRTRVGRRNRYQVRGDMPFRHPSQRHHEVGQLLAVLGADEPAR
jgi:predicted transcriptional regulator